MSFTNRLHRRGCAAPCVVLVVLLAGCGGSVSQSPSSGSGGVDLSKATPATFVAHASIEQLYVTDADPHTDLELVGPADTVIATGTTDDNGTLIFRDLTPGPGYTVAMDAGGQLQASHTVAVMDPSDPPAPSFYSSQQIGAGYGYLKTRDGTLLAINVILPGPVEDGPYPTVVEYSGYDPANPDAPQPSTLFASTIGYAAVGVNMRGSGCSGGAFDFFEPAQSTDGYDVVETIAAQPWVKNHKVGMVGISYPGISQLFVAQYDPPHLAAIAPLSVIADTSRGTLYPGGILNNGFAVSWALDRQHDATPGGQPWSQKRIDDGDQTCIDNQKLRAQSPDLLQTIYDNNYYDPKIGDPLAPVTFVDKIKVPVFLAGAWQDEQTGPYFATMLDKFTGTNKIHFTMTNGGHTDSLDPAILTRWAEFLSFYVAREIPKLTLNESLLIEAAAGAIFGVNYVPIESDRFSDSTSFDEALARFEADPKVRILFDNGTGLQPGSPVPGFEHAFDQWPIKSVQPTIWYFQDAGRLAATTPTGNGADSYRYDPSRAQSTSCDNACPNGVWVALPNWNWQPLTDGAAVAYATDPLTDTLVMAGSGSVDLWIESTAKDTDLQVTLSEIRPDGQETYVQSGWLRASQRKLDAQASTVLRPVQTHTRAAAADLPAGQFVEARVELFPFAHVFRAGSRIRISVEAPGGDRPLWKFGALPADGAQVNTIAHSAAAPSRLVLPVVPGIDVTTPLPKCPALRGQPCRAYVELSNTPA